MKVVRRVVLAVVVGAVLAQRLPRAIDAYRRELSGGARPIQGVATAVAAFVGLSASDGFDPEPGEHSAPPSGEGTLQP